MKTLNILKSHGVKTKIEGSLIFGLEVNFNCNTNATEENWVDVTNWTSKKLMTWLGY